MYDNLNKIKHLALSHATANMKAFAHLVLLFFLCGSGLGTRERIKRDKVTICTDAEIDTRHDSTSLNLQHVYITMKCSMKNIRCEKTQDYCRFSYVKLDKEDSDYDPKTDWNKEIETLSHKGSLIGSEANSFCNLRCDLDLPAISLGPGFYKFVSRLINNSQPFVSVNTITLSAPVVEITNCPNGPSVNGKYIKENTKATCECRLKSRGIPPARKLEWFHLNGSVITSRSGTQDFVILDIPYTGSASTHQYICQAMYSDNFTHRVTYTPTFAYGPARISLITPIAAQKKLCPPTSLLQVVCDLLKTSYYPDVIVTVEALPSALKIATRNTSDIQNNYKRHTFSLSGPGGRYKLTCVAYNTKFMDLQVKDHRNIEIKKPPTLHPDLSLIEYGTLTNGQTVNLTLGDTVTVQCRVFGGAPVVKSTILDIAGNVTRQNGNSFAQAVNITNDMDGMKIKCSAEHETGCYMLETAVTVNLLNGANISTFLINGKGVENDFKEIIIEAETNLTITCVAGGKPLPSVTILDSRGVEMRGQVDNFKYIAHYVVKIMSCEDEGRYTCLASNDVSTSRREILVLVKCPVVINEEPKKRGQHFHLGEGENVTILINVKGYPAPSVGRLQKVTSTGLLEVKSTESTSNASRYSLVSQEVAPSSWQIRLTLFQVKLTDAGRYQLELGNGIGKDLNFTFDIRVSKASENGNNTVPIIAAVVGIIVFIIVIVVVFVLLKRYTGIGIISRRRRKSNGVLDHDNVRSGETKYENDVYGMNRVQGEDVEVRFEETRYDKNVYGMNRAPGEDVQVIIANDIYGTETDTDNDKEETVNTNSIYGMNPELQIDEKETVITNSIYGMNPELQIDKKGVSSVRQGKESDCDYAEIDDEPQGGANGASRTCQKTHSNPNEDVYSNTHKEICNNTDEDTYANADKFRHINSRADTCANIREDTYTNTQEETYASIR